MTALFGVLGLVFGVLGIIGSALYLAYRYGQADGTKRTSSQIDQQSVTDAQKEASVLAEHRDTSDTAGKLHDGSF